MCEALESEGTYCIVHVHMYLEMCVLGKRLRFLHSKSDAEILCIIYQDSPSKNWMVGRYIWASRLGLGMENTVTHYY